MNSYGPGPIIHGPDVTDPGRFVVQLGDGTIAKLTPAEIAAVPLRAQWFTGTVNGLIASWWNRPTAEASATARGTLLGQVLPMHADTLWDLMRHEHNPTIVILADADGQPLPGHQAKLGRHAQPPRE